MRKLLSGGLMVVGMASLPVAVSPRQVEKSPAPEHRTDLRLPVIRQFFERDGCPASQYAAAFLDVADTYALDWRLLPSLSYVESTGGKASHNNNMFGWDSGRAQFASPLEGIYTVGDRLARSGLYRGKSLDQVLALYNPDADYGRLVKSVMRRIAPVQ